jgi:AAA domain
MKSTDERETLDEFYWRMNNRQTANTNEAPKAKEWRTKVFDAAGLHSQTFEEVKYVIPNLIPEGVSILAGRPKIGKSWMALDLALTTALKPPSFCMGNLEPLHGDVLYCALEDNPRRLKRRIARILSSRDVPWPERLHLANEWRRLDSGGVDDLREWAESVPNPVLIILDTLAGVRPERRGLESVYDGDYRALAEIHSWANKIGIAVVVLHHTRKMEADDPLDSISGSLGLAGCADTSLVLNRTGQGTTLYLRGRDVEEAEHAVSFDPETCRWTIMGDAAEIHRSESRGSVLAVLDDATEPMSPAEIASAAALPKNNVDQLLYRMGKAGEVTKLARGKYAASSRADLIGGHRNHTERKERTGHHSPKLTVITKPMGGSDAAV